MAFTNLAALRGDPVTRAARSDETEWEIVAGPGGKVREKDTRLVALGILLAFDPTLEPVTRLAVGEGLSREGKVAPWHGWD